MAKKLENGHDIRAVESETPMRIMNQIHELTAMVDSLSLSIASLELKLEPVLLHDEDSKDETSDLPDSPREAGQVSSEAWETTENLRNLNCRVLNLLTRL